MSEGVGSTFEQHRRSPLIADRLTMSAQVRRRTRYQLLPRTRH
jgi:hypothetical protein